MMVQSNMNSDNLESSGHILSLAGSDLAAFLESKILEF